MKNITHVPKKNICKIFLSFVKNVTIIERKSDYNLSCEKKNIFFII